MPFYPCGHSTCGRSIADRAWPSAPWGPCRIEVSAPGLPRSSISWPPVFRANQHTCHTTAPHFLVWGAAPWVGASRQAAPFMNSHLKHNAEGVELLKHLLLHLRGQRLTEGRHGQQGGADDAGSLSSARLQQPAEAAIRKPTLDSLPTYPHQANAVGAGPALPVPCQALAQPSCLQVPSPAPFCLSSVHMLPLQHALRLQAWTSRN